MLILLFRETSCPSNVAYLNHILSISFFFRSMHLYISVSYFVCLSHTLPQAVQASSGTTSIHYQSPFTLKAIQIRIILTRNDMFTHDCDIYSECACGCDVSACVAGNKRIGSESARRETVRAGHAKNRLIPITGRSISASLFYSSLILMMSNPLQGSRLTFCTGCTGAPNFFS